MMRVSVSQLLMLGPFLIACAFILAVGGAVVWRELAAWWLGRVEMERERLRTFCALEPVLVRDIERVDVLVDARRI